MFQCVSLHQEISFSMARKRNDIVLSPLEDGNQKYAIRSNADFVIEPFARIAQMVIIPVIQAAFEVVDEFDESQRGAGGFGSTGKH